MVIRDAPASPRNINDNSVEGTPAASLTVPLMRTSR